jgi:hypothetical protein
VVKQAKEAKGPKGAKGAKEAKEAMCAKDARAAEEAKEKAEADALDAAKAEANRGVDMLAQAHTDLRSVPDIVRATSGAAEAAATKATAASALVGAAIAQQTIPVPSEMDALLAATQAAQADARLIVDAAKKSSDDAEAWYDNAGGAILAARASILSGELQACLERRQDAEAEHEKLRRLLDTADEDRRKADAAAEKAATSVTLLNELVTKLEAQASGASRDAEAAGGGGAGGVVAQVHLKPSTAVQWLPPALGQRRNVLVQNTRAGSKALPEVFLQTAGFTARKPALVPVPAGNNKALRPGVWVCLHGDDYVVSMSGYSQYTKAKPVLAVCLTKPPDFTEHFQARLQHVRLRGDEVSFCFLFCVCCLPW